ncbi:MAG: AtpZ/AtpI family protein [Candidatus Aminicenantes bacterium]|jgi:Uncharacterized protein conserved in bacteria|nr:AtpZ/AtpI family protein [Candidatus Aminicenantes bacterium]
MLKDTNFKKMAQVSSLALILPSSIIIGLAIGYLLDRWLKTEPWMLLTWTVFGVVSGLLDLFKEIKKYLEEDESVNQKESKSKESCKDKI